MDIFQKLKDVFDSHAKLAGLLGGEPMMVYQWKARGRIPAERCPEIVELAKGRIELHELRPDLYPDTSKVA